MTESHSFGFGLAAAPFTLISTTIIHNTMLYHVVLLIMERSSTINWEKQTHSVTHTHRNKGWVSKVEEWRKGLLSKIDLVKDNMPCKFRTWHVRNQNSLGKMITNSKPFLKMNFYTMNKLIQNNNFQLNNDLLSFLYSFQEMKKEPR